MTSLACCESAAYRPHQDHLGRSLLCSWCTSHCHTLSVFAQYQPPPTPTALALLSVSSLSAGASSILMTTLPGA